MSEELGGIFKVLEDSGPVLSDLREMADRPISLPVAVRMALRGASIRIQDLEDALGNARERIRDLEVEVEDSGGPGNLGNLLYGFFEQKARDLLGEYVKEAERWLEEHAPGFPRSTPPEASWQRRYLIYADADEVPRWFTLGQGAAVWELVKPPERMDLRVPGPQVSRVYVRAWTPEAPLCTTFKNFQVYREEVR